MDNTARVTGGGFHTGNRASFTKTGGIIYGSNAPAGYRNTVLEGDGSPKTYGHAVCVAIFGPSYQFRNDTVGESDKLSYAGVPQGSGTFGIGDKWDNPDKVFLRMLAAIILPIFAATVCVFLVYRKRTLQKVMRLVQEAANSPVKVFENVKLTTREKEVGKLLLSELSMKLIADVMAIAYATADFHSRKLYRKMGIQGRMELLRMRNEEKRKI
jgi:DNA-binding CsgD family transcriptional regulator